jgi:hypothetical protein
MNRHFRFSLSSLILLAATAINGVAADYQLQTLEKAHSMFRAATNSATYAEAAQQYEFLVSEEGVQNGHLFYTMGNCWFMAGDIGRAILNYRRAEQYLPRNKDIKHNLKTARDMRTDLIPRKRPHPLMAKLLGWHLNTSTTTRWWIFAPIWMVCWASLFWMSRSPKKEPRITAIAAGIISVVLLISLLAEYAVNRSEPCVIIATDVLARKGDGNMYAPAFLEPLHAGTEFLRLEDRGSWWHIRLADGQTCWIPSGSAQSVALSGK